MTANIVVVRDLGGWRESWDALVATAPVPSPFLRTWWLEAVAGSNSRYVLVVEDGAVIGGLALERVRRFGVSRYRFAGSGDLCPDHLDLLAAPTRQSAVVAAVSAWLGRPGSRALEVTGLVEDSLLAVAFGSSRISTIDVAPWEPLPVDHADYLAARSGGFRREARRCERRLTGLGVQYKRVTVDDLDAAMRDFRTLHVGRGDRGRLLAKLPVLTTALSAGMARGEAEVHLLVSRTGPVSVSICFRVSGRLSLYQTARSLEHDFRSATTVLELKVIEHACSTGCNEVDLLRGDEPYKASYATRQRKILRLRTAHGILGHLWLAAVPAAGRARGRVGSARRWLCGQRAPERSRRTNRRPRE